MAREAREVGRGATVEEELGKFWLLGGITSDGLTQLAAASRPRDFAAGEVIFRQGDAAGGIYFVRAGQVRISAEDEGTERQLGDMQAGDCFGELEVLDGEPNVASAVAATSVTTWFIPTDSFLDLVEREPSIALKLLVVLSERLLRTDRLAAATPASVGSAAGLRLGGVSPGPSAPARQLPQPGRLRPFGGLGSRSTPRG